MPAYSYLWAPSGGTGATASGLTAGTYTVTVTDSHGCTATHSYTITQPALLDATYGSSTNVTCAGFANGSATVNVSGGTPAYSYAWAPYGGNGPMATGLAAGVYTVTVTDANGCTDQQSFTISEPPAIILYSMPQNDTVVAGGNAQFSAVVWNADAYQWLMSADGITWNNLTDGGTNPVVSGAQNDTLTLTNVPSSYNHYRFKINAKQGTACSETSNVAVLTVTNVLQAVNDDFSLTVIHAGDGGVAGDVTMNDLFNNQPVNDDDITISVVNNGGMTGVTIDAGGNLNVPPSATQGNYTVTYSVCENASPSNCSQAEAIVVVSAGVGITEADNFSVIIYPNPTIAMVNIELKGKGMLQIYDFCGKKMGEMTIQDKLKVDLSQYPAGVYLFRITYEDGITVKRVVREK
jgi:hypothetical protein